MVRTNEEKRTFQLLSQEEKSNVNGGEMKSFWQEMNDLWSEIIEAINKTDRT